MKTLMVAILITFVAASTTSSAQEKGSGWCFYTGQDFLDLPQGGNNFIGLDQAYVAGVSDAFNNMAAFDSTLRWIYYCTKQRKPRQLAEILREWLKKHPERWHEPASSLFLLAIRESCQ